LTILAGKGYLGQKVFCSKELTTLQVQYELEENCVMHRSFKFLFGLLILAIWVGIGQTVRAAMDTPQTPSTTTQVPQESPSIKVPESTYDFGEIMEGGEVAHDFIVTNTGKAPLEINQVRPG
jgi:hypothetical protein